MRRQLKSARAVGSLFLVVLFTLALATASCNGNKLSKNLPGVLPSPAPLSPSEQEKKIIEWAYRFAVLIYDLPGFESKAQGQKARDSYETYRKKVAKDYSEEFSLADPFTGLKVALFKPVGEAAKLHPWVLAFAGSESVSDWISDVGSGGGQFEVFKKLLNEQISKYRPGETGTTPELLITGHSLGGGLAQAAAYQIDKDMLGKLKIHLVTWNALGTIDLIKKLDPSVSEPQLSAKNRSMGFVAHYFVCDDIVSQLGRHWQGTLRKVDDKRCLSPEVRLPRTSDGLGLLSSTLKKILAIKSGRHAETRIAEAHFKETFMKAVSEDWAQLQQAPVDDQHDGSKLTKAGLGVVLGTLPKVWPSWNLLQRDEDLTFWLRGAIQCDASSEFDQGFLGYLEKTTRYAIDVYTDANKSGQPKRADHLSDILREALRRVSNKACWQGAQ
jgi:hypothetical protein